MKFRDGADPRFKRQYEVAKVIWTYKNFDGTKSEAWHLAGHIINSSTEPELFDDAQTLQAKEAVKNNEKPEFFGM